MASVEDSMWMENLEESVFEDKKPVTYKWLSRNLNVHVNIAKQMLFEFADKNKTKVSAIYLLAGKNNNNNIVIKLVKENDLKKAESSFKQITSKHIHTVSLADGAETILSEMNVLNIDVLVRKEHKPSTAFSGITNKTSVPRSSKHVVEPPMPAPIKTEVKEIKKELTETKVKPKAKSGIEGMFDKQKAKSDVKPVVQPPSANEKPTVTTGKKAGVIAGMFAKQAASGASKKPVAKISSEEESPENSPGKENKINQEKEESERKEKEEKAKKRPSKSRNSNPSKRRKRIQVASDSDSSDEEAIDDPEPIPDSPPPPQAARIESDEEDLIPSTPVESGKKSGRGRVRKMVKKTYLDEDGFMVTKMEQGSCSEDSNDKAPKKEVQEKVISPVKTVPPTSGDSGKKSSQTNGSAGKTKQASIMNFFTKK